MLVVDDDAALAEMLGIVLRGKGFEPTFVADGDKAVEAFGIPGRSGAAGPDAAGLRRN